MISIDLFAGGGGASEGIRLATGRAPVVAVNHDPAAIEMHRANHPDTIHLCESVYDVEPRTAAGGRRVDLLWASPDCTHFSRAKGGRPRQKRIRALAWVVVEWARQLAPRVLCLENVPEFTTWGPLDDSTGQPIREQAGETFRAFLSELRALGYVVAWRVLCAADYGAPTSRKRLFLVARKDGVPRWPVPTRGPGRAAPHRTAAECIDWSIPMPSIFGRARPLAEATQRRIAEGIRRYVLGAARPFLVTLTHGGRLQDVDRPMPTVTAAHRGEVALVSVWLAKHYGGVVGQDLSRPLGTVTAIDHHSLAAVHLTKLYGTSTGNPVDSPVPTVTAGGGRGGGHLGLVAAFLARYYGQGGQWSGCDAPLPTVVSRDRFALVTVAIDGEPYVIVDIGMRMLQPRELARAQGFPDSYALTGSKAQQVARIGNSVPPPLVRAVVSAQLELGEWTRKSKRQVSLFGRATA